MPKVDMGVPKPQQGEEEQARAGATLDPKHFKGNAMFSEHLAEVAVSMLKQKFEMSAAMKTKKKKHRGAEDYGISLPEEEILKQRGTKMDDAVAPEEGDTEVGGDSPAARLRRAEIITSIFKA